MKSESVESDFFRFPSIPCLVWLTKDFMPHDEKVLPSTEVQTLLSSEVVMEEKLDGAKLVCPDFTQAIDTHWSKRTIEWNRVDWTQS